MTLTSADQQHIVIALFGISMLEENVIPHGNLRDSALDCAHRTKTPHPLGCHLNAGPPRPSYIIECTRILLWMSLGDRMHPLGLPFPSHYRACLQPAQPGPGRRKAPCLPTAAFDLRLHWEQADGLGAIKIASRIPGPWGED